MEIIDKDFDEELLWGIMNAAHTEYHLLEIHEKNHSKGDLTKFIQEARDIRRCLMNELITKYDVGAIWCVLKHALLTHFHLLELYQKNYEKVYIELAQRTYLLIDDMLKAEYPNYSNCARCEDDQKDDYTEFKPRVGVVGRFNIDNKEVLNES